MKIADIFTLILLLTLSFFLLFWSLSGSRGRAVIIETPTVRMRYSLNKDRVLVVQGLKGESKIEIRNGRVRMLESACDHKICVKKGWTDRTGDSIVCLPNRVRILIVGGQRKVDAITQ